MIKKLLKDKLGILPKDFKKYLEQINTFGFDLLKLEKDFYLTITLGIISKNFPELIFKGGTCLNKVYLEYFRLSEDLDFDLIMIGGDNVRKRTLKTYVQGCKEKLLELGLTLKEQESYTQKNNTRLKIDFTYVSMINGSIQEVKIEISIKDKKQIKPYKMPVKSIFIEPLSGNAILEEITIICIDFKEAVAEKVRVALTRKAIRDFFDIRYIKTYTDFDFTQIQKLIAIKLAEVQYAYTIDDSYELLKGQIEEKLSPVFHKKHNFDFDEVHAFILSLKPKHTLHNPKS